MCYRPCRESGTGGTEDSCLHEAYKSKAIGDRVKAKISASQRLRGEKFLAVMSILK